MNNIIQKGISCSQSNSFESKETCDKASPTVSSSKISLKYQIIINILIFNTLANNTFIKPTFSFQLPTEVGYHLNNRGRRKENLGAFSFESALPKIKEDKFNNHDEYEINDHKKNWFDNYQNQKRKNTNHDVKKQNKQKRLKRNILGLRNNLFHLIDKALDIFQDGEKFNENNLFLSGNFAPVSEEHWSVPIEVVEGSLPSNLDGLFIRNGPNPIPGITSKRYHWFDGHGMLHNVRIKDGKATYTNNYIPTPRYMIEKEMGEAFFVGIGEMCDGLAGFLKAIFLEPVLCECAGLDSMRLQTANNNAIIFQNRFFCLEEASLPFEIFLSEEGAIESGGHHESFDGFFNTGVAAHSRIDPESGNFLAHTYMHEGPTTTSEISAKTGKVESKYFPKQESKSFLPQSVPVIHDISFTKNWRVVFDSSFFVDLLNIIKGEGLFSWDNNHNMRIGLVPRWKKQVSSNEVRWIDTGKAGLVMHPMNAWEEEDGTVVVWTPITDRFGTHSFDGKGIQDFEKTKPFYMVEFRIQPATGAIESTVVENKINLEGATVHPDFQGKFSRFGYTGINTEDPALEGTLKGFTVWDMKEKKMHHSVEFRVGEYGSEPILIPKPGRKQQSNAVYLGFYTHDMHEDQSYFLLFDGETQSSSPITRLRMPHRVPFGFHGLWLDGKDLYKHIDASHGYENLEFRQR